MERVVMAVTPLSLAAVLTCSPLHLVLTMLGVTVQHLCMVAALMGWVRLQDQSLKAALRSQGRLVGSQRMQELETNSVFSGSLISKKVDAQGFGTEAARGTGTGSLTRSLVRMFVLTHLALHGATCLSK